MKNQVCLALLGIVMFVAVSCEQKDLCYDHWDHDETYDVYLAAEWKLMWEYPVDGGTDWKADWAKYDFDMTYEDLLPEVPDGIKVQVYTDGENRSATNRSTSNIPAEGGKVSMSEGTHQILMYNNDTEYIVFNDIESTVNATATTRSRSRATYVGNSFFGENKMENTVNPPDALFGHYIASYTARKSAEAPVLNVMMKPLVFRYVVRYYFDHGLEYVGLGRGALAGMAGSVYLTDGHTGSDVVTVLYDCEVKSWGVEAVVNSFGAPNYPNPDYSRSNGKYGLNLEVRLKNGHIYSFDFDVTDRVMRQPRGGVIEVHGINITDEMGKEDTGSFDVDLDGWGEFNDVYIDF